MIFLHHLNNKFHVIKDVPLMQKKKYSIILKFDLQEVIMMLDQCSKDFRSLIERMNLIEAYEKAEEGKR